MASAAAFAFVRDRDRDERSRRESFFDWLSRMENLDPETSEFWQLADQIEDETANAISFRWHAKNTQAAQDRVMRDYWTYVKVAHAPGENLEMEDERAKSLCFPEDHSQLLKQLRVFLGFALAKAVPRSNSDPVIGYSALMSYRKCLNFWVARVYPELGRTPPPRAQIHNTLTNVMRMYLKTRMGQRTKKSKAELGVPELMQLIDVDMMATPCIALAEGMHIAWLLGRQCALRPGSLGCQRVDKAGNYDADKLPYLAWKDISITRGDRPGVFNCEVTIRNLKGSLSEYAESGRPIEGRSIVFTLNSPTQIDNLAMSVPHRLLVAALRHKGIVGIDTLNELLEGSVHRIRFKPEMLNRPVIMRATPRGLDVIKDQPATVAALTEYLQRRGERNGYTENITFYSIRRRAATDFARAFGPDHARTIMNHDPDTRTMERYYLNFFRTTNVTSAALGETAPEQDEEMMVSANYLALNRLGPKKVSELYGAQLNAAVRKLVLTDKKYAQLETAKGRKNRERVLRKSALRSLIKMAQDEQDDTLTTDEMRQRKDEVMQKMTTFNEHLLAMIQQGANEEEVDAPRNEEEHGVNFDDEFEEADELPEDAEGDVEDALPDNQGTARVEIEEELFVSDDADMDTEADKDTEYLEAVRYTMGIILENSLSEYSIQQRGVCPLCVEDPTTSPEEKAKLWVPNHIKRHMASIFHSDFGAFKRRAEARMKDNDEPGWVCEICVHVHATGWQPVYYAGFNELSRHVSLSDERSLKKMQGRDYSDDVLYEERVMGHLELKREMGWFRDDFKGDTTYRDKEMKEREVRKHRKQALDQPEFAFTEEPELEASIPVSGQLGMVYGAWKQLDVMPGVARLGVHMISQPSQRASDEENEEDEGDEEPLAGTLELSDYHKTMIRVGPVPTGTGPTRYADNPPHEAHLIKMVRIPGAPGNKEKDGLWLKHRLLQE